jgi:hypothetical protein
MSSQLLMTSAIVATPLHPSFNHLCSKVRHKQKSLVVHVHKKVAEELKKQSPAAELFRVQALSLTGAKEWLTAKPYEHDPAFHRTS